MKLFLCRNQLLGPILSALRILFPRLTSLSPALQTTGLDLWAAILPELNLCLETEDISLRAQMAIVRGSKDQLLLFEKDLRFPLLAQAKKRN